MPQNVRIEGTPVETIISDRDMEYGKAYIVTNGGTTGWAAGMVAFRAGRSLIGVGDNREMGVDGTVRVRDLQSGEKITIQGS